MKVADVWLPGTFIWNDNLLHHELTDKDANIAKKLMLSRHTKEDNHICAYTKNASYSV